MGVYAAVTQDHRLRHY